jgi:hypothetical protein
MEEEVQKNLEEEKSEEKKKEVWYLISQCQQIL